MRNDRIINVPGKTYSSWQREASKQLYGIKPVKNIQSIDIVIFAGDKRKGDLTNKAESIMDLLVDNKIIPDDNWYIVSSVHLKFAGIDKNNPRAEVTII